MIHVVMIRVRLVMSSKSVAVGVTDPKGIRLRLDDIRQILTHMALVKNSNGIVRTAYTLSLCIPPRKVTV